MKIEENESDRGAREVEGRGLFRPVPDHQQLCGDRCTMVRVNTQYGQRVTCAEHRRVWTRLWVPATHRFEKWVEEKYTGFGVHGGS